MASTLTGWAKDSIFPSRAMSRNCEADRAMDVKKGFIPVTVARSPPSYGKFENLAANSIWPRSNPQTQLLPAGAFIPRASAVLGLCQKFLMAFNTGGMCTSQYSAAQSERWV
jgi:hypothetical protein